MANGTNGSFMETLGAFVHTNWMTFLIIVLATAAGGILARLFSWTFAIIVPLFVLFVGYVAKVKYERKNPL